ncbi:MAG: hypothetical protein WB791_02705, partial [Waddliaceae bacterium]
MDVECLPKEGSSLLFTLTINGEVRGDIHAKIFGQPPTIALKGKTRADLIKAFYDLEYRYAKTYILKRLAIRACHSQELSGSLQQLLVSTETIQRILEMCRTMGYIDDQDWMEGFIRRQQRLNAGP